METISVRVVCVLLVTSCALDRANGEPISALRLIAPTRPNSGLLEVYSPALQGWGLVCDDMDEEKGFEFAAAVCYNYLNFPGTAGLFSQALNLTALESGSFFSCDVSPHNGTIMCSSINGTCPDNNALVVTCKGPGYLGCFEDNQYYFRVLSEGPVTSETNTVSSCIASCKERDFFYAGLEFSKQCFCGNKNDEYGSQGKTGDDECSDICTGDDKDTCGDSDRIAIYEVDLGVCGDPGSPDQGMRIGDSFRYGDIVQFNCPGDFVLEGDHSLQCIQAHSPNNSMAVIEVASHRVTRQMWRRSLWQGYHRHAPRRSLQRSATSGSELRRDSGASWGGRPDSSAEGVRRRRSEDRHAVKWNGTVPVCRSSAPSTFGPSTLSETAESSKPTGLPQPSTATPNPKPRDGEPLADKRSYIYAGAGVAICLILVIIVVIVVVIRKRRGKVREIDNNHTDNNRQRDPGIDDEGAIEHQGADNSASLNLLSASEQPSARENLYSEDNSGDGEVDGEHNYAYADPGRAGLLSSPIDSPLSHEYIALQTRQGDIAMDSDPTRTGMDSSLQIQRDLATPSTEVYANTEFHEVPSDSDMVTNELYGS